MKIQIGNFDFTEVWDGVFYKKLSQYPKISDWEVRNIIEFIDYEAANGRECELVCEDTELLLEIKNKIQKREKYLSVECPKLITECTACPYRKGCVTEYVCHTTSPENAEKIFDCGKLLSAVKARKVSVEELMRENRNAAKDPADYFDYIMFGWGNCQAGDRLVMERKLSRFPDEADLSTGFMPGIRFYFKYENLRNHPNAIFDGVLPMKIKDEVILKDWVDTIIIPSVYRERMMKHIPKNLLNRVVFIDHQGEDIWDWAENVYMQIEKSMIHFSTKRLQLHNYRKSDYDEMRKLLINEEIKKTYMIPDFSSEEQIKSLWERLLCYSHSRDHVEWGIYLEDKLIGFLNDVDIHDEVIELGYLIHPDYQGKGYATESLQAAIQALFKMGYTEIQTAAFEENSASTNVMVKCGMKRITKTEDIEYHNSIKHCVYYSICKG